MKTYGALLFISLGLSLALTPLIRRLCERFKWLDVPRDDRRVHNRAVPRLGGVAIFLTVGISLVALFVTNNLVTKSLHQDSQQLIAVLGSATLVFAFGVYDDLFGLNAYWKIGAQGVAGALLFALGGRIEAVNLPFLPPIVLPMAIAFLITIIWVVIVTNAFNLIDGMDGLAAGAALFASLVMLVISLMSGRAFVTVTSVALVGALIGFLRYNFNPASIFLGDSGSLFIGFLLAALSLQGMQKASTTVAIAIPVLAFGLPLADTSIAVIRRFISGRPLFEGDREHVHHMLLARGWSQRRVAIVLYGVSAIFGFAALLFTQEMGRSTGFILLVVGAAAMFSISRLRYHELDEIKASVYRNVTGRRRRAKNNLRVRRVASAVSDAKDLPEVLTILGNMLDSSDFDYAMMQIGGDDFEGEQMLAKNTVMRLVAGCESHAAKIEDGAIKWKWVRQGCYEPFSKSALRHWTLHIPLSTPNAQWGHLNFYHSIGDKTLLLDVNCLCNILQPALAGAVERILNTEDLKGELTASAFVLSASGNK